LATESPTLSDFRMRREGWILAKPRAELRGLRFSDLPRTRGFKTPQKGNFTVEGLVEAVLVIELLYIFLSLTRLTWANETYTPVL